MIDLRIRLDERRRPDKLAEMDRGGGLRSSTVVRRSRNRPKAVP